MFIHAAQHLKAEGAPANPCDPDPEMLLTVTGASGTVNWCGETWNLPADSGDTRGVCPTAYNKGTTSIINPYVAFHNWDHAGSLFLGRQWSGFTTASTAPVNQQNAVRINNNQISLKRDKQYFMVPSYSYQIGLLTGEVAPTWNSYDILNSFFGSYTESGITYAWAKGAGW